MTYGLVKPTNAILVQGKPFVQELKIETATNCYPGRLVITGTNDDDVVVCGAAGIAFGWLGYEQADANFMPTNVDTIYTVNHMAPVLYGGNFVIVGHLANGESVKKGDRLTAGASGELIKAVASTVTAGATPVTGSAATGTISGGIPLGGIVVAIALETVNASTGAADIMVKSMI